MKKSRIDKVELSRLLRSGKNQKEIAKLLNVSPSAVCQAKKELNINVVKSVALESAHRVVDKNLNAIDQLQKINVYANELLDLLMRWSRGDNEALQILESQVTAKKVRVGDKEEFIKEYKMKDPRDLALKAMAEIRGQLNLQLDIFKTLYDMKAIQGFQQEVLDAVAQASPEIRDRIVANLKERRALRGSIDIA